MFLFLSIWCLSLSGLPACDYLTSTGDKRKPGESTRFQMNRETHLFLRNLQSITLCELQLLKKPFAFVFLLWTTFTFLRSLLPSCPLLWMTFTSQERQETNSNLWKRKNMRRSFTQKGFLYLIFNMVSLRFVIFCTFSVLH